MAKILVVDDETDLEVLIRQKFRKKIKNKEYDFVFAINGSDALEKLGEHQDIDMVLSDINMPQMDGLTLLGKLNVQKPLLKSVIVSAYGDMKNIRTAMNRGAYDFITKPIDFEDLTITMEKTLVHVNQIKETVKALQENNILKMYVDENVINFMSSRDFEKTIMDSENIEATVVFIDICKFTAISENYNPSEVVKILNTYFDVMVKDIIAHKGEVDKFIGDAVMAVFKGEKHLTNAVKAAKSIRKNIEELPSLEHGIKYKPKVSIGINTGDMVSGNIGSATLKRLDYTVIGDIVNTAQRLQNAAKENQIIVNEDTLSKLEGQFEYSDEGEVTLKNKAKATKLFDIK